MSNEDQKPPDRVDRIIAWFRNHPVFAPLIVVFIVLAALAAIWKPIFGVSIVESLNSAADFARSLISPVAECDPDILTPKEFDECMENGGKEV